MTTETIDQQLARILAEEAAAQAAWESTTLSEGYRVSDLRTTFDALCDPTNWKGPIAVWVLGEAVGITCAAIRHFTATEPTVGLNTDTMRYLVQSIGYQAGPAGDH